MGFVERSAYLDSKYYLLFLIILFQTGWFTADNASNNFSAIKEVGQQLKPELPDWDPRQHYVR